MMLQNGMGTKWYECGLECMWGEGVVVIWAGMQGYEMGKHVDKARV